MDKKGETINFLFTEKRDKRAVFRFLRKAIGSCGKPSLIKIDQSVLNTAVIKQYTKEQSKRIQIRQCKYLNNIVEQDHRLIKRITKPILVFKNFYCAQRTLVGIELIRILRKEQMRGQASTSKTPVELFYVLAR